MADKKLIGSFYFRRTPNGNLIGEFTNNNTAVIMTESADFIENSDGDNTLVGSEFLGGYNCSWRQGEAVFRLNLRITRTGDSKFELNWTDETNTNQIQYYGEGFIAENLLIGHYIIRN